MLQRADTLKRDLLAATLILARSSNFSSSTTQKRGLSYSILTVFIEMVCKIMTLVKSQLLILGTTVCLILLKFLLTFSMLMLWTKMGPEEKSASRTKITDSDDSTGVI